MFPDVCSQTKIPRRPHTGAGCLAEASATNATIFSTIRGGHLQTHQESELACAPMPFMVSWPAMAAQELLAESANHSHL